MSARLIRFVCSRAHRGWFTPRTPLARRLLLVPCPPVDAGRALEQPRRQARLRPPPRGGSSQNDESRPLAGFKLRRMKALLSFVVLVSVVGFVPFAVAVEADDPPATGVRSE